MEIELKFISLVQGPHAVKEHTMQNQLHRNGTVYASI